MNPTNTEVKCVIQCALLNAITNNLRAVTASVAMLPQKLVLNFYYENPPTENEIELSQIVSTEVLSGFKIIVDVREKQIILPLYEPLPIEGKDILVYYRYEKKYIEKEIVSFDKLEIVSVKLASQYALLGAVTNNLRAVSISYIEEKITSYFYYDKAPSDEEIDLSEKVTENIISCFEKISGEIKRFVIPEPERIPLINDGIWVYWRYEEYPNDD